METARAASRIPPCNARNDSRGVSEFLRSDAVSDMKSRTRGNKVMGIANDNNL